MPPRRGFAGLDALVSDLFPPPPRTYASAGTTAPPFSPIVSGGGASSDTTEFQRAFQEQHGAAMDFYNSVIAEARGSRPKSISVPPAEQHYTQRPTDSVIPSPPPIQSTNGMPHSQGGRICANCGADAADSDRFCRQCGTPFPLTSGVGRMIKSPSRPAHFTSTADASRSSARLFISDAGTQPSETGVSRLTGRQARRAGAEPRIPPPPQDLVSRPRAHDGDGEGHQFEVDVVRRLMREREGDAHSRREGDEVLIRKERGLLEQRVRQDRRRSPGRRRLREPPPHLLPIPFSAQRRRGNKVWRSRSAPGTPAQNQRDSQQQRAAYPVKRQEEAGSHEANVPRRQGQRTGDSSMLSSILSPPKIPPSFKERMQQSYTEEPCLRSGYFSPGNLRGQTTFGRTPRFLDLSSVRDPGVAFYFLDDAVQNEIRSKNHRRSRSEGRRSQRVMIQRGLPNCNVTPRWGLRTTGGEASPGPGSYDPLWAKASRYSSPFF